MDYFKEKELAKEWEAGDTEEGMTVEQMADIVIRGFGNCGEEFCISREACSEDSCACIRDLFPTPQHFEVYKEARAFFERELCRASFIRFLSKGAIFSAERNK